MKERFKKIISGLLVIVFALVGMWEYMQLFMHYDLPQAVIVLPIVGALSAVFLKKFSFLVPAVAAAASVVYQISQPVQNSLGFVENSKFNIILNLLPVILIFMLIGIGGGMLIRVLINANKSKVVGVICCVLGVVVVFGFGIALFGNPTYPFMANHAIHQYADKFDSEEYKVSEISTYYSLEDMQYQGRVVMSDGVVYVLYHDKAAGSVSEAKGH